MHIWILLTAGSGRIYSVSRRLQSVRSKVTNDRRVYAPSSTCPRSDIHCSLDRSLKLYSPDRGREKISWVEVVLDHIGVAGTGESQLCEAGTYETHKYQICNVKTQLMVSSMLHEGRTLRRTHFETIQRSLQHDSNLLNRDEIQGQLVELAV